MKPISRIRYNIYLQFLAGRRETTIEKTNAYYMSVTGFADLGIDVFLEVQNKRCD